MMFHPGYEVKDNFISPQFDGGQVSFLLIMFTVWAVCYFAFLSNFFILTDFNVIHDHLVFWGRDCSVGRARDCW